jgi:hypothetical protein
MSCLLKRKPGSSFPMSLMRVRAQDHTMKRVAVRKGDWKEQENETMLSCNGCYTSIIVVVVIIIIIIIIIIFFKGWYNILAKIKLKTWHEIRGVLWDQILKVTSTSFFSLVQLIKLHFMHTWVSWQNGHSKLAVFFYYRNFSHHLKALHLQAFLHTKLHTWTLVGSWPSPPEL